MTIHIVVNIFAAWNIKSVVALSLGHSLKQIWPQINPRVLSRIFDHHHLLPKLKPTFYNSFNGTRHISTAGRNTLSQILS